MSNNKRIRQYLHEHYPEFEQALEQFFGDSNLLEEDKITFIIPTEETRKLIIDKINNGDSDAEIGRILRSHILDRSVRNNDEFMNQVVTLAGFIFPVSAPSQLGRFGKTLTVLEGKTSIAKVKDFENDDVQSLYMVVSGELPTSGIQVAYDREMSGSGEDNCKDFHLKRRMFFARHLSYHYADYVYAKICGCFDKINPYLEFMTAFVGYLRGLSDQRYYNIAISLLDPSPIASFYILLQPFKTTGQYIIPDNVVQNFEKYDILVDAFVLYNALIQDQVDKRVKSNPQAVNTLSAYKKSRYGPSKKFIRTEIYGSMEEDMKNVANQASPLGQAIATLVAPEAYALFQQDMFLKAHQDYMRFLVSRRYESFGSRLWKGQTASRDFIVKHVCDITNFIECNFPGNNSRAEIPLPGKNITEEKFIAIYSQVYAPSAQYLYIPGITDAVTDAVSLVYSRELLIPGTDIHFMRVMKFGQAYRMQSKNFAGMEGTVKELVNVKFDDSGRTEVVEEASATQQ